MASLRGNYSTTTPFCRQSTLRASTGALKRPKLPGSERFRFHGSAEDLPCGPRDVVDSMASGRTPDPIRRCQSPTPSERQRRRAKIVISKQTSRVLNNTNTELSADAVEYVQDDASRVDGICREYVETEMTRDVGRPVPAVRIGRWIDRNRARQIHPSDPEPDGDTEQNWMHLRNRYGRSGTTSPTQHPPDAGSVWVRRDDVLTAR